MVDSRAPPDDSGRTHRLNVAGPRRQIGTGAPPSSGLPSPETQARPAMPPAAMKLSGALLNSAVDSQESDRIAPSGGVAGDGASPGIHNFRARSTLPSSF